MEARNEDNRLLINDLHNCLFKRHRTRQNTNMFPRVRQDCHEAQLKKEERVTSIFFSNFTSSELKKKCFLVYLQICRETPTEQWRMICHQKTCPGIFYIS